MQIQQILYLFDKNCQHFVSIKIYFKAQYSFV